MGTKRVYDYEAADKLGNYVRRRYRNQLSNGALQIYFSLPYLEKQGLGCCQPITANYKTLGFASFKDSSGLKKPLQELEGVLCEVVLGSPIKEEKKATQIRRYTLKELMNGNLKDRLIDYTPVCAKELAEQLNALPFVYGSEKLCQPFWHASKAGKVISSKPNVHGNSKGVRARELCAGLGAYELLFHLDFKQAEPSIIRQAIETELVASPYEVLAEIMGVSRGDAKSRINSLAYSPLSAVRILDQWPREAQTLFMPYASALDSYKEKLWVRGKPHGKRRRFVSTLGGTRVEADRGQRAHRGQLLNWHIQGTVADIVNAASRKIIKLSEERGWRYCFPLHDAVYVIGTPNHQDELRSILENEARRLNLKLEVKVETFDSSGSV